MPHYSKAQQPEVLFNLAKIAALGVYQTFAGKNITPVLAYRGMSGVACATAVSYWLQTIATNRKAEGEDDFQFVMAYTRKENEESHGTKVEHENVVIGTYHPEWRKVGVFVDDFVSSGKTFQSTVAALKNYTASTKIINDNTKWWVAEVNTGVFYENYLYLLL